MTAQIAHGPASPVSLDRFDSREPGPRAVVVIPYQCADLLAHFHEATRRRKAEEYGLSRDQSRL